VLAGDHTVVIRRNANVSMWYILEFLRSEQGRGQLRATVRGTAISRISTKLLKQILIPNCPLGAEHVDRILQNFENENQRIQDSVDKLHHRLFEVYRDDLVSDVSARLDSLQGIAASMQTMANLGDVLWIAKASYPYPIARSLRVAERSSSPRERYHEVVHESQETLSATLACICASVARHGGRRGEQTKRWLTFVNRGTATIGRRYSMIREVAHSLGANDIGGLGRAFGDDNAPAVALVATLLKERNRIHDNYPRTEIQFEQRLVISETNTRKLLEALGFLARWELRYAESVEPIETGNSSTNFIVTFRVLRGDNPDWDLVKGTSRVPMYRGRTYAVVDDQLTIDMYPYMIVRNCEICGALEVFSPNSFDTEFVRLQSIDRGHSQEVNDPELIRAVQAAFT
jgi:hypothetical protein